MVAILKSKMAAKIKRPVTLILFIAIHDITNRGIFTILWLRSWDIGQNMVKMAATGTNEKNGNNLIGFLGFFSIVKDQINQFVHKTPTNNISNQTIYANKRENGAADIIFFFSPKDA